MAAALLVEVKCRRNATFIPVKGQYGMAGIPVIQILKLLLRIVSIG